MVHSVLSRINRHCVVAKRSYYSIEKICKNHYACADSAQKLHFSLIVLVEHLQSGVKKTVHLR